MVGGVALAPLLHEGAPFGRRQVAVFRPSAGQRQPAEAAPAARADVPPPAAARTSAAKAGSVEIEGMRRKVLSRSTAPDNPASSRSSTSSSRESVAMSHPFLSIFIAFP